MRIGYCGGQATLERVGGALAVAERALAAQTLAVLHAEETARSVAELSGDRARDRRAAVPARSSRRDFSVSN